jgi:quercetin dioxygenase-like cupin family protein
MVFIKPVTDEERASWPTTVKVELAKAFEDERGAIQPLVDVTMESCVLITSKPGSVRANHFHKTDWHYCYVLSGEIEYYHRSTGTEDKPEKVVIRAGELFWTPPMVDHAMVFPVETSFLTFGRNSREQAVYEADVVRIPPINP